MSKPNPSIPVNLLNLNFVVPFIAPKKKDAVRKRRSIGHSRKKCGVYLIMGEGEIVYVGMSQSCVVESLYRHFYKWADSWTGRAHHRKTYWQTLGKKDYKVLILHSNKKQAPAFERALIMSLRPRDNAEKYEYLITRIMEEMGYIKATVTAGFRPLDNEGLPF